MPLTSLVALAALSTAACGDQSVGTADEPRSALDGEWQVVAIDGVGLGRGDAGGGMPLVFRAGDEVVRWEPACAQLMFLYRADGGAFRADRVRYRVDGADRDPAGSMPPPCMIGLPPGLEEAMEAMGTARTIEVAEDGRIHLSGGGRSLLIKSR